MTAQCRTCEGVKDVEEFPLRSYANGRSRSKQCRTCHSLHARLKKRGISYEEVIKLWHLQSKKCKLCDQPGDPFSKPRATLHIDHDHQTKQVRGLLCNPCNWKVGVLEVITAEWLSRALIYIEDI